LLVTQPLLQTEEGVFVVKIYPPKGGFFCYMNLKQFFIENKIWFRFIDKPETIHTADAAKVANVDLNKLTKSLILISQEKELVLAIIPGNCRLEIPALEKILNIKKLNLVPFNQAEKYSGYLPGATPPVGHKRKMKVVIDEKLFKYETIFGGGGNRDKLVELKTQDVIKLNNAKIASIV
jgi:Cys-tRNA(Pro)/Cys-tRNA(Cys) deacylase